MHVEVDDPGDVVQGEIVCEVVDTAGRPCPSPVPPGAARCDSHTSTASDQVPTTTPTEAYDVDVEAEAHPNVDDEPGADEPAAPAWPWGTPMTAADRRRVALREAGYRGWIDWDGYPIAEPGSARPRRLTESEVATAIAGDGYHGSPTSGAGSDHPPQSPDGQPADGSEHDVLVRRCQQEMEEPLEQTVTAVRGDEQVAQVRVGGGLTSAAGLSGELEHIADLDAEAATVAGVIEQAQVLAQTLRTWQDRLPERSSGVIASTQGVEAAVAATAEASSTAELRDVVADLRREVEKAHQVGDGLTAAGVSGDVAGITPR